MKLKAWLLAAVLLFFLIFLFSACSRPEGEGTSVSDRPAPAVEALRISRGRLIETIEASGTISGIEEATIVAETGGIIEEVSFELGREVAPTETLVQVDDEIAFLGMQQAEQDLETARIDLQSKEQLVERGGVSRAEVLRSRSALRGAEARYRQAKKAYEDCSIASPISGYVAEKYPGISAGNYLSPGNPVARIVDLSSLRLKIAVGESTIGLIETGSEAEVVVPAACEERVFEARVVAVAAGSDPATGSYPVVLEWKNDCGTRIKSGMSARAVVRPRQTEEILILPAAAVASRGGRTVAFVVEAQGTVVQRKLALGRRVGNRVEVLSGLAEGDAVVISGISGLSDGDSVRVTVVGESGTRE
jgi:RND family efflux transporter MFP subunit